VEEGIDLEKIKKDYNIPVKESGFFSKEQSIPDIGWSYDFVNAAFNLKPNQVSEIVELSKGYYILKLKGKKDAFIPQYSQIKEKVKQAYIQNEAFSLAREKANFYHKEIKNKINEGASFKKAAENLNLEVAETDFFNRYDYIKGIGQSQGFKEAAFSNKEGNLSKVVKVSKGYCLLKADEYKPINEKKFEEIKEEYRLKAAEKKKMQIFSNWFANLRKEAKIKSYL
jgi:peptidyl-prolyl cis-trans isomerase D